MSVSTDVEIGAERCLRLGQRIVLYRNDRCRKNMFTLASTSGLHLKSSCPTVTLRQWSTHRLQFYTSSQPLRLHRLAALEPGNCRKMLEVNTMLSKTERRPGPIPAKVRFQKMVFQSPPPPARSKIALSARACYAASLGDPHLSIAIPTLRAFLRRFASEGISIQHISRKPNPGFLFYELRFPLFSTLNSSTASKW
jgi:hypothetical protein